MSSETGIAFSVDSNERIYKTSDNVAKRRDTHTQRRILEKKELVKHPLRGQRSN